MLFEKFAVWFVLALLTGVVCYFIAKKKGRDAMLWFIAGVAFNVLGVAAIAMVKNLRERRT